MRTTAVAGCALLCAAAAALSADAARPAPAVVRVSSDGTLGGVLVDASGRTLYDYGDCALDAAPRPAGCVLRPVRAGGSVAVAQRLSSRGARANQRRAPSRRSAGEAAGARV